MPLPGMEVPANKKIVSSQKIIFLSDFNVDDDDLSALKRCPCVHVVGNDKLHTRTVAAESSCATEWLRGRELGSSWMNLSVFCLHLPFLPFFYAKSWLQIRPYAVQCHCRGNHELFFKVRNVEKVLWVEFKKRCPEFRESSRTAAFLYWNCVLFFFIVVGSVTRKKSPNVYKSCPKMISLEKW